MSETIALVGAAGGVGTTGLTLACGRLLAAEGYDTAILDAAYGTQGLSDRVSGRIDPDVTALCLNDGPIQEGLIELPIQGAGRLAACPAHAPFERIARAKTPDAAERFGDRIEEAARHFEYVLVDTPPIATNPAIASAVTADTVAIVCDDERAAAAVPRTVDRLTDIGTAPQTTIVTGANEHPDADVAIPAFDEAKSAADGDPAIQDALGAALETMTDVRIERNESAGILDSLPFKTDR